MINNIQTLQGEPGYPGLKGDRGEPGLSGALLGGGAALSGPPVMNAFIDVPISRAGCKYRQTRCLGGHTPKLFDLKELRTKIKWPHKLINCDISLYGS